MNLHTSIKQIVAVWLFFATAFVDASAETLDSEPLWELCRNNVVASAPDQQSAESADTVLLILKKCGFRPYIETKINSYLSHYALPKSECDTVYERSLQSCLQIDKSKCGEGQKRLPLIIRRHHALLSPRAFSHKHFDAWCKLACEFQELPERQRFGRAVCGERESRKLTSSPP